MRATMFSLRYPTGRVFQCSLQHTLRRQASRIAIPFAQPSFPTVPTCPSPTCQCRDTPSNLEIDRETSLNGSIGTYAEQLLISTGRSDWKSRIEDDEDAKLLKQLKGLLGRGGKYSDVCRQVAEKREHRTSSKYCTIAGLMILYSHTIISFSQTHLSRHHLHHLLIERHHQILLRVEKCRKQLIHLHLARLQHQHICFLASVTFLTSQSMHRASKSL